MVQFCIATPSRSQGRIYNGQKTLNAPSMHPCNTCRYKRFILTNIAFRFCKSLISDTLKTANNPISSLHIFLKLSHLQNYATEMCHKKNKVLVGFFCCCFFLQNLICEIALPCLRYVLHSLSVSFSNSVNKSFQQ